MMKVYQIVPLLLICALTQLYSAHAQVIQSQSQTVGNGSAIAPSAGEQEAFGITSASTEEDFPSRHMRRGQQSGIGSSFLQTTSPTSEGSPAAVRLTPAPISSPQFRLPKLQSAFQEFRLTPALDNNTPTFFAGTTRPSRIFELQTPAFTSTTPQFEEVPSFSKRPAFNDQMQFNQIEYKGLEKSRW